MSRREKELVDQLLEKTLKRAINWEPTAEDDQFVSSFAGRVSFVIQKRYRDMPFAGERLQVSLIMQDEAGREMLKITPDTPEVLATVLEALYEEVRRAALKVDESLDQILDNLKKLK